MMTHDELKAALAEAAETPSEELRSILDVDFPDNDDVLMQLADEIESMLLKKGFSMTNAVLHSATYCTGFHVGYLLARKVYQNA